MKRFSRKMSDEHKQKISEALKGIKRSDRTRAKQSKAMKDYWASIPYEIELNKEDINIMNDKKEK